MRPRDSNELEVREAYKLGCRDALAEHELDGFYFFEKIKRAGVVVVNTNGCVNIEEMAVILNVYAMLGREHFLLKLRSFQHFGCQHNETMGFARDHININS